MRVITSKFEISTRKTAKKAGNNFGKEFSRLYNKFEYTTTPGEAEKIPERWRRVFQREYRKTSDKLMRVL